MALLDEVKTALRVDTAELNDEIQGMIDTAKKDLNLSGGYADKLVETDSFIKTAIKTYCKAHHGYDDPKLKEQLQKSYESMKQSIAMAQEYAYYEVTFNTGQQCKVTFDGKVKETDSSGTALFYTRAKNHIYYSYLDVTGYIDVDSDVTVGGA
jgi:hypothetical protein